MEKAQNEYRRCCKALIAVDTYAGYWSPVQDEGVERVERQIEQERRSLIDHLINYFQQLKDRIK
jgi:hypothetical protein